MNTLHTRIVVVLAFAAGIAFLVAFTGSGAQAQGAPRYRFDLDWPKPMPNKWKIGGVTGLAVDKDDNVWVLNRPNDLRDLELQAEIAVDSKGVIYTGEVFNGERVQRFLPN